MFLEYPIFLLLSVSPSFVLGVFSGLLLFATSNPDPQVPDFHLLPPVPPSSAPRVPPGLHSPPAAPNPHPHTHTLHYNGDQPEHMALPPFRLVFLSRSWPRLYLACSHVLPASRGRLYKVFVWAPAEDIKPRIPRVAGMAKSSTRKRTSPRMGTGPDGRAGGEPGTARHP